MQWSGQFVALVGAAHPALAASLHYTRIWTSEQWRMPLACIYGNLRKPDAIRRACPNGMFRILERNETTDEDQRILPKE